MDMADSLPGCAVREVKEETGYDIEITGLVGTYTDPRHVIAYTDGEVRRGVHRWVVKGAIALLQGGRQRELTRHHSRATETSF
jgi:8-oxo-dGTP pyrophosphatase MutT (NUDIX family)